VATVNFSVPEEVKRRFNTSFARQNKSRIIADLMAEAVDRQRLRRQRSRAIEAILRRRRRKKPIKPEQMHAAREEGRP
jgi:hypothetical protein